jgi:hypothetical protein
LTRRRSSIDRDRPVSAVAAARRSIAGPHGSSDGPRAWRWRTPPGSRASSEPCVRDAIARDGCTGVTVARRERSAGDGAQRASWSAWLGR